MAEEGVEDAAGNTLRTHLMMVTRVAEQIATLHQNRLRAAAERGAQEQRELQNRLDTERLQARAQLAVVERAEWWEEASAEHVAEAWQTAEVWRTQDPQIARYGETIEHELDTRYGIQARELDANAADVRVLIERARDSLLLADQEERQARADELEAMELLLEADAMAASREYGVDDAESDIALEQELRDQAGALSESADGHRIAAGAYRHINDDEARHARIVADRGQVIGDELVATAKAKHTKRPRAAAPAAQVSHEITR